MKRLALFSPLLALPLIAAQCASAGPSEPISPAPTALPAPAEAVVAEVDVEMPSQLAPASAKAGNQNGEASSATTVVAWDRKIIKTAQIQLETEDVFSALNQVTLLSSRYAGYVVNSRTWYENDYPHAIYSFAVPVERFEEALERVRVLGKVLNESTTGQDVTDQYVDLEARIRNLEVTAERIRGFMAEAETVQEALSINQELSQVEQQLERLKGQRNALAQQAAFSTISVEIKPLISTVEPEPEPKPEPAWSARATFSAASAVLVVIVQALVDVVIWVVVVGLPLALLAAPLWLLSRRRLTARNP